MSPEMAEQAGLSPSSIKSLPRISYSLSIPKQVLEFFLRHVYRYNFILSFIRTYEAHIFVMLVGFGLLCLVVLWFASVFIFNILFFKESVFNYQLVIHNKAEWVRWEDSLDSSVSLPRDIFAGNMIIPTLETIKYQVNLEE